MNNFNKLNISSSYILIDFDKKSDFKKVNSFKYSFSLFGLSKVIV